MNLPLKRLNYAWLLFDADDTLFDFPRAEANALKWTLETSGIPFRAEYFPLYSRINQQVWKDFEKGQVKVAELRVQRFRQFLKEAHLTGDLQKISELFLSNLALGTDLIEHADEVIHTLKAHYPLALVTNGLHDVQRPRLEASALKDCFEHVFISEEIGYAKPAREFFERVFVTLGFPAREDVLIIGDSLSSDMLGGINYGMDTCWFNPKKEATDLPVTFQISDLDELQEILL